MKRFFVLWVFLCVCISSRLQAQATGTIKKQKLNVLYVGGSANWENAYFEDKPEEKAKDVQRRTASFETLLKQYFTSVKVVDAADYSQAMSGQYDVTVIDGTPKPISEKKTIKDASGKITKYIPAGYLTEAFDKPVLFIGETGEKLGRTIGLKLDWYCLCLDANALNFRKEHEIFKGPFPVKMTVETKPTPKEAFHYEYFLGSKTPETIPMWKVQTKGYASDKNFRIGMVARPWGFEDSPDAEYISSGVCQKTLDAVALGRHGNFFHWGFAASPEYMTAEAQTVFANAVSYISKFDGKGVIARKYLDRRATREWLKERKYYTTREAYESSNALTKEFDKRMLEEKATAEAKKAKGEKLTSLEESSLNYKPQPEQSFENFVKRQAKELYEKFGTDAAAYAKYFDENKDYFYSEDAMYVMSVDEDVKTLGIPYYEKRLLDKAISLLENGEDIAKAKRILDRYTMADFATAAEWRNWYEKNRQKMFFTEPGGYYFMINTYDKSVPGNDYKKKAAKLSGVAEPGTDNSKKTSKVSYDNIQPGETSHENPVAIAVGMVNDGGSKKDIVVKIKMHPGYHIYANVADVDPYIVSEVKINVPPGFKKVGDLQKPSFGYFNDQGTTIYEDEVTFVQEISGAGQGEANCIISYQCCDSKICFPPEDKSYTVKL